MQDKYKQIKHKLLQLQGQFQQSMPAVLPPKKLAPKTQPSIAPAQKTKKIQKAPKQTKQKPFSQKSIKQSIKEVNEENSDDFENYLQNMCPDLINHAKKWKGTCQNAKQAKQGKKAKFKKDNKDQKQIMDHYKNLMGNGINVGKPVQYCLDISDIQLSDSFEKELDNEESDQHGLAPPSKPLGPYILFLKQRRKSQSLHKISSKPPTNTTLSQSPQPPPPCASSWQQLPLLQKDKYYLTYQSMLHKYNILVQQYRLLTGKKKALSAYNRYYRKIYGELEVSGKYSCIEMTRKIKEMWASLPTEEKEIYEHEELVEKFQIQEVRVNWQSRATRYLGRLEKYEAERKEQEGEGEAVEEGVEEGEDFDNEKERELRRKIKEKEREIRRKVKREERERQKKAQEEQERKRRNEIRRRLIELKDQQIMRMKEENYRINGYPKSYFSTPSKPCLEKQQSKLSNSAETNPTPKQSQPQPQQQPSPQPSQLPHKSQQSCPPSVTPTKMNNEPSPHSNSEQEQEYEQEYEYEQEQENDALHEERPMKKTKKIRKSQKSQKMEEDERKPGISKFKKIIVEMQNIYG